MDMSNVVMWVLVVIMVIGLLITFRNLNGKVYYSKYEGMVITVMSLVVSCFVGVGSN